MNNGGSPRAFNGKDSSNSGGKNTLMGLVRRVSRGGKLREKGRSATSNETPESSSGYRRVTPNVAPASTYPIPSSSSRQEILVWGRPPALMGEGRTIEGVELVDEGPSQRPGSSHPLRQVQRISSRGRDRAYIAEEKQELSPRRSIDSLFSSMNAYVPTLPHQDKTTAKALDIPRRAVSVRVNGQRSTQLGRASSISSTPRAKPAQDVLVSPPRQSSPFQGAASTSLQRSISNSYNCGQLDDSEEERMREAFTGKGAVWAVARGWKRGIVATFEEAEQQTRSFPGPVLRQFENVDEAIEFLKTPSVAVHINGQKENGAGVHFEAAAAVQRRDSRQRQISTPEHVENATNMRRAIKYPATNPFLSNLDRKMSGRSFSTGSPADGVQPALSPGLLLQGLPNDRNGDAEASEYLLPSGAISNSQNEDKTAASTTTVSVTSIVMSQDLEICVRFYHAVLGFNVQTDNRYKGEVVMRHNCTQSANLTLRSRAQLSPSPLKASSPSRIPVSMYRSSILLDVGHCDISQLHAGISSRLNTFQTASQDLNARIEDVEVKVSS
jgi:hypothetical protein